jgi:hypothetical protein
VWGGRRTRAWVDAGLCVLPCSLVFPVYITPVALKKVKPRALWNSRVRFFKTHFTLLDKNRILMKFMRILGSSKKRHPLPTPQRRPRRGAGRARAPCLSRSARVAHAAPWPAEASWAPLLVLDAPSVRGKGKTLWNVIYTH